MLSDLINNNYKIKFMETYKDIIKKNNYIINNINKDILSILIKKTDDCLLILKKKIEDTINNEKYMTLNPVFNSILSLLVNINNKSILMYINITINVILYSVLHVNSSIINSNKVIISNRNKINNSAPYLPSIDKKYKYSLVLDMDGTLIHFLYKNKNSNSIFNFNMIDNDIIQLGMFLLRPYAKLFLEKLKNFYEIIIFTNGTKEYCDKILDFIDPNQEYIKFRLYRKHSINKDNDIYLKDLSLLGRDLSKIIIIDDLAKNYKLQQDNGLPITCWKGDINDTTLKDLIPILKKIVEDNIEDVRNVIVKIKDKLKEGNDINYLNINKDNDLL
jgi:CTD small phosphatase-like protein 2